MKNCFSKFSVILGMIILIGGCSNTGITYVIRGEKLHDNRLLTDQSSIYLVNGGDGMMGTYLSAFVGEEVAVGSGESAINIEFEQLRHRTRKVILEKTIITEDKALEIAKMNQSEYLIYSRTEKWTDPLGINCSEIYADEATVLISLYSVADKKLLQTSRLSNSDCPTKLNGMPLRPGSPERLFEELFANWLTDSFAKQHI